MLSVRLGESASTCDGRGCQAKLPISLPPIVPSLVRQGERGVGERGCGTRRTCGRGRRRGSRRTLPRKLPVSWTAARDGRSAGHPSTFPLFSIPSSDPQEHSRTRRTGSGRRRSGKTPVSWMGAGGYTVCCAPKHNPSYFVLSFDQQKGSRTRRGTSRGGRTSGRPRLRSGRKIWRISG